MRQLETDYSNGAYCVLEITHITDGLEKKTIFNALDEAWISEYVKNHIGEQVHAISGCPIYMEIPGWAYAGAGADEEYSLDNYSGINSSEWKVELKNRSRAR